jgi:hypothetical protein
MFVARTMSSASHASAQAQTEDGDHVHIAFVNERLFIAHLNPSRSPARITAVPVRCARLNQPVILQICHGARSGLG